MTLAFSGWHGAAVLAVFGLVMLGVGLAVSRGGNIRDSMSEYYLAGRGLGLLMLFFTLYATQYSGNTIVGYAPTAYRMGFGWIRSVTFMVLVMGGYLLFAPRLYVLAKRYNFLTPSDWLQKRFNSRAVTLVGTLLMLYGLGNYLLEQFVAIGQGVAGLTAGIVPYQVGVLFFIVIMLVYEWLGGMRAVAITDVLCGVVLLLGIFGLLIGSIITFGGLGVATEYMFANAPKLVAVPSREASTTWLSTLILIMIGAAVYPQAIQRIYSAKSERTLKQSLSRMAWMPFITTGVVLLIGLIGVKALPGLDKMASEQLVGMMANAVAAQGPVFYGLMLLLFAAVIGAIVSTADSVILTMSSMFSKDIYARHIAPSASEKQQVLWGKVAGIIVVFLLLLIAWNPPGTLYELFILKFEVLIQVAPAFIIGLYWKKLSRGPVLVGMLAGAILAGWMTIAGIRTWHGWHVGLVGLALNTVICVVGSYLFPAAATEQQEVEEMISL
ncbi:MAG: sodium:solute symporter family protein [Bacillota bacterium]